LVSFVNQNKTKDCKLLIFVSVLLCLSVSLGVQFATLWFYLQCFFKHCIYKFMYLLFLKKFFQGPREFTVEAVLDRLNYKEDLKKNIFLRCLWWKLNWAGTLVHFIELWTTRYIIEICNKNNFGWFWLHLTTIIKIEKVPSY